MKKISSFIETNSKKIILISLVINLILVSFIFLNQGGSTTVIANTIKSTDNSIREAIAPTVRISKLMIEVVGEVNNPGIYRISNPIMTLEAIDLAGGLTSNADMEYVHKTLELSKMVTNNEKIYIPDVQSAIVDSLATDSSAETALININTATNDQLDVLPGVGPVTAQKIISGRPYSTLEDLKELDGISDSLYTKIVTLITI